MTSSNSKPSKELNAARLLDAYRETRNPPDACEFLKQNADAIEFLFIRQLKKENWTLFVTHLRDILHPQALRRLVFHETSLEVENIYTINKPEEISREATNVGTLFQKRQGTLIACGRKQNSMWKKHRKGN